LISVFSEDARSKRCVVEGGAWVPMVRAATGPLAAYHARPLTTYRIRDDIGVLVTVIDGEIVEASA
jgi:hypothetical protein